MRGGNSEQNLNNFLEDDIDPNAKTLNAHSFWYNENGNMILEDIGEFSTQDKCIDISVNMLGDMNTRAVDATILVFVGGVLKEFNVDGISYLQYSYEQELGFQSKKINISIPIDNIEVAYDNNVRILYVVCDKAFSASGDDKILMNVMEKTATITDLVISEPYSDEVERVDVGGISSWIQTTKNIVFSNYEITGNDNDTKYCGVETSKYDVMLDKCICYYRGEEDSKQLIYHLVDGKIVDEPIYYNQLSDTKILKKEIYLPVNSLDGCNLAGIAVPIGNKEAYTNWTINVSTVHTGD